MTLHWDARSALDLSLCTAFNIFSESSTSSDILTYRSQHLSAPSRRPEIRRRRTRKEKILKLRKRLGAAGSETDRSRLTAKLERLARKSPGQPLVKS